VRNLLEVARVLPLDLKNLSVEAKPSKRRPT
jgi:hypothetical protein